MKRSLLLALFLPLFSLAGGSSVDAASFGFSVNASGLKNRDALQKAVDKGGTIVVSRPGVYRIAGTVYEHLPTIVHITNSIFNARGEMTVPGNSVPGKRILLKSSGNVEADPSFHARIDAGEGIISLSTYLTVLN